MPIKWLAIEALLQHEFSFKTDVWSFGILLYEMYSFGEVPFVDIPTRELGDYLKAGNRPEAPELCNDEIFKIMQICWQEKPEDRPTFDEILEKLTKVLERATGKRQEIKL